VAAILAGIVDPADPGVAIIPLKERVIDELYDPVVKLFRMFRS